MLLEGCKNENKYKVRIDHVYIKYDCVAYGIFTS